MFGKTTSQPAVSKRTDRHAQSFLQGGVRLEGDMHVEGDMRVEGVVHGSVTTTGVLMIGPGASVDGEIEGVEVVIRGQVAGIIRASGRIHLSGSAKVKGDLYCQSLVIEEGVFFEGRSHMGETPPARAPRHEKSGLTDKPQPDRPGPLANAREIRTPTGTGVPTPEKTISSMGDSQPGLVKTGAAVSAPDTTAARSGKPTQEGAGRRLT